MSGCTMVIQCTHLPSQRRIYNNRRVGMCMCMYHYACASLQYAVSPTALTLGNALYFPYQRTKLALGCDQIRLHSAIFRHVIEIEWPAWLVRPAQRPQYHIESVEQVPHMLRYTAVWWLR